jgi:Helix-turn-helix domain
MDEKLTQPMLEFAGACRLVFNLALALRREIHSIRIPQGVGLEQHNDRIFLPMQLLRLDRAAWFVV